MAEAQARAEDAARREGEQGLGELVGALARLDRREGVQPVLDPAVHVRLQPADGDGAQGGQQQADRDPAGAAGGDVQQDDEQAEEQQRGAEVALQDQDADAQQPDRERSGRARGRWAAGAARTARPAPVYASALRLAARYAAKKTASSTFANSPGWMENPAIRIQMRAPFTAGKRIGRMQQDERGDDADVRVALAAPGGRGAAARPR